MGKILTMKKECITLAQSICQSLTLLDSLNSDYLHSPGACAMNGLWITSAASGICPGDAKHPLWIETSAQYTTAYFSVIVGGVIVVSSYGPQWARPHRCLEKCSHLLCKAPAEMWWFLMRGRSRRDGEKSFTKYTTGRDGNVPEGDTTQKSVPEFASVFFCCCSCTVETVNALWEGFTKWFLLKEGWEIGRRIWDRTGWAALKPRICFIIHFLP